MSKLWGKREFWGVGSEYDPQWALDDDQAALQADLIELCRTTLRPNAVKSDETYEYPRANMDALTSLGLLGLIVPRELGGLGQNHRCAAMVVETIARYGCPSTAMIFVMHLGACSSVLLRCHDNEEQKDLMRRLDRDKLIGTEIYSDPATGGHLWYPLSSKCWQQEDGRFKALKFGSWATSAGFADWYVVQMTSPNFAGDYSNLTNFLFYKEEIRANTDEWSALGMHGNQSGPTAAEAVLTPDRVIGPIGDGAQSNDETVNPFFLLNSSCCWNGISMAAIDLAKKHVTNRGHSDVGLRVCDYPTIQDYFGEALSSTNSCRLMAFSIAALLDEKTNNSDWSIHKDPSVLPRASVGQWMWQLKFQSAKNVCTVTDSMLHACGGTGYKTDLGLERLLRDGKAGWVMGPSNEVLRNLVGRTALLGMTNVDLWAQKTDERALNNELKKLSVDEKADLAKQLLKQVEQARENSDAEAQENDQFFDHPFNITAATAVSGLDGHETALTPDKPAGLKLTSITSLTADKKVVQLVFALPTETSHLGTLPGQYVEILVPDNGKKVSRYMSPVSAPEQYGRLEIVVRYENQGVLARFLGDLKIGQVVEFRGPCGGFEYVPNKLSDLIFICGGTGVTPAIQVIRSIAANKSDLTRVTLMYQVKNRDNFIFKEELDQHNSDKRINVISTLQDPDGDWSGPEGEIGRVFLATHLPHTNGGRRKVVLCGGPAMILCCLDGLYQLGYRSEEVFIYGPFGAQQIRAVYGAKAKLTSQLA